MIANAKRPNAANEDTAVTSIPIADQVMRDLLGATTPISLIGIGLCLLPNVVLAHVGEIRHENPWTAWSLTPDLLVGTTLIALIYSNGVLRRNRERARQQLGHHVLFAAGTLSVFLALASPIDYMAEHLFSVHQVQHLFLRMMGPLLIALAAPQAVLISGLPLRFRHGILAPLLGSSFVRGFSWLLTHPVTATFLFIAALYVWQYPPWHDAAILDQTIHYIMHLSMLAAGLLFWWRIFDARPSPIGLSYGKRLMMIWLVILSNILLGAYTTLKGQVLYSAYDVVGRLFGISAKTDEAVGGFVIWMPSSMMCLLAVILIIHAWGRYETRLDERRAEWSPSNSAALLYPTTGEMLIEGARPKNRSLALGILMFVFAVFGSVIFVGYLAHLNGARSGFLANMSPIPINAVR